MFSGNIQRGNGSPVTIISASVSFPFNLKAITASLFR